MPSLPAQVVATSIVKAVQVRVSAGGTAGNSIPTNSDVSAGFFLPISKNGPAPFCSATAWAALRPTSGPTLTFENHSTASPDVKFTCLPTANAGPNAIVSTFRSLVPIAGRLVISIQCTTQLPGASCSGSIDVGDDGTVELDTPGQRTIDVVVGPHGLPVLLGGAAAVATWGRATSVASVSFQPAGSRLGVSGAPCGPVFEGFYTGKVIRLQASQVPTGQFALFAFGTTNPNVRIPPLGCGLYTDILAAVGVAPTAGQAGLTIPLSSTPTGTFRMQFLIVSGGAWRTSNALTIRLP